MTSLQTVRALREVDGVSQRKFARSFASARKEAFGLTEIGARRAQGVLQDFRGEILSRLAFFTGSPDDPFLVALTPQIAEQIGVTVGQMVEGISAEWAELFEQSFDLGSTVTARALTAADVPFVFPSVSRELLTSAISTTGDLLSEVGLDLGRQIMRQVRIGAVGLEPASATMRRIDELLRTSREVRKGLRRRIGFNFQAETIARTELGRIYANAQQTASEQTAEQIPDLKKRWVTNLGDRRGHRLVEQRYDVGGEIGPIPIRQRFEVTDFSRSDRNVDGFWTRRARRGGQRVYKGTSFARRGRPVTDRMLFPRDPSASPGNQINCTCTVEDVVPGFEDIQKRARGEIQSGEAG